MSELLHLTPALIAGLLLGAFFFGGLWWTVRHCVSSKWAAPCFLGSLLLRTVIVLAGFYFVPGNNWQRLVACLLGFVLARLLLTYFTRAKPLSQEASHAP